MTVSVDTTKTGDQGSLFSTLAIQAGGVLAMAVGSTFNLYNTADQTTNYERLRLNYVANVAQIFSGAGGSGSARDLRLGISNIAGATSPSLGVRIAAAAPFITLGAFGAAVSSAGPLVNLGDMVASAGGGVQTVASVAPTINQSGTAGATILNVDPTLTATGSGTYLIQRWGWNGTERARLDSSGILYAQAVAAVASTGIGWSSSLGGTIDLRLVRDAANELALRLGTAAQAFRVYNTYTDGSNYERGAIYWNSNVFTVDTGSAGTGLSRAMTIGTVGSTDLTLKTSNSGRWQVASSGHFVGSSGLYIRQPTVTVASLPSAASIAGARMVVSDANATTYASIVAGGGANTVPVFSDGTNWRIG